MGVMDKFLNAMRLNPDDEDYDEFEDDFYDEPDEDDVYEAPKKSFRKARPVKEEKKPEPKFTVTKEAPKPVQKQPVTNNKVTPMRSSRKSQGGNTMEVCVIKPTSVEDAREITETLLANRTVILNLEGLDLEIAQRIIDFTSGSCFAVSGNLQKISNYIFVVTPATVDISGDFQDLMSAFDVSSLHTDI